MNSEFPNEEIFPSPSQSATPPNQAQLSSSSLPGEESEIREAENRATVVAEPVVHETEFVESRRMPPQVVSPVVVAPPVRKPNRLALTVIFLCATLIVILCLVSRDFRLVFFLSSAIWIVLHAIIRMFKL